MIDAKKNKKGELTTQQIVLLIILIMSFVVVLYFLFKLNIGPDSEKEICHNSVVMKGNPVLSKGDVSLNCQRTYVCLTKDGSCEQMTNPEIKKVESKTEIYKVMAEEMADCWWMFGEGKVDYLRDKALPENYCSICTQLAFDNSFKEIPDFSSGKINKDEFYDYLATTPISEGRETYAEYLFGTNNIPNLKQEVPDADTFGTIDVDKHYFVMMGIVSEIGKFQKAIGIGVANSLVSTFVGPVISAIVFIAGTQKYGDEVLEILEPEIGAIIVPGDGIDNEFMVPTIVEANSDKFKLLKCKDILTVA